MSLPIPPQSTVALRAGRDPEAIRSELMVVPKPRDAAFVERVNHEILAAHSRCREILSTGDESGQFDQPPLA